MSDGRGVGSGRVALAWGVHLFTASGALAGAATLIAILRGDYRAAVLLMLVALFIDAVDGMLARAVGVSEVLPGIDGRRLDDMVDYLNYVIVPAVFMVANGSLTHPGWVTVPILASAYGFSQANAKTPDAFFLGFPSYWNVLAIYLWMLETPPATGTAILIFLSAAVFLPLKYIYPSRMPVLRRTTAALALVCILLVAFAVLRPEQGASLHLVEVSLGFPAYYVLLSCWLGRWARRRA